MERKLVIIIPVLNEEKTIADVISHIPDQMEGISPIETILIDEN